MKTAREWKEFYANERLELGKRGLFRLVARAPEVRVPDRGALVFPHTRLRASGELVAAAARAVIDAGCDEVLALGVLHGAREQDADVVQRARAGDAAAIAMLRRVHGPGAMQDDGRWSEEFSLDNFRTLLAAAAKIEEKPIPRVIVRYPFLTGDHPDDLPGLDELARIRDRGAAIVATADVIHHGAGYATPRERWLPRDESRTQDVARGWVEEGFDLLARRSFGRFLEHAADVRSDFRDAGPVLAALLGGFTFQVRAMVLVDYADALEAEHPTWVAATLTECAPAA